MTPEETEEARLERRATDLRRELREMAAKADEDMTACVCKDATGAYVNKPEWQILGLECAECRQRVSRGVALAFARRVVEEAAKLPSACNLCMAGRRPAYNADEGHFFHDVRICPNERLWYLLSALSDPPQDEETRAWPEPRTSEGGKD